MIVSAKPITRRSRSRSPQMPTKYSRNNASPTKSPATAPIPSAPRQSRREDFLKSPKRQSQTPPPVVAVVAASITVSTNASKKPVNRKSSPRRSHSSSSNSSALSYSPARRNPERYKDVFEQLAREKAIAAVTSSSAANDRAPAKRRDRSRSGGRRTSSKPRDLSRGKLSPKRRERSRSSGRNDKSVIPKDTQSRSHSKEQKRKQPPQPVVRLHASTDDSDNDAPTTTNAAKNDKYDEMLGIGRKDDDKDLHLMKALSGIAAKAKEKIKTMSEPSTGAGSKGGRSPPGSFVLSREMAIANVASATMIANAAITTTASTSDTKPVSTERRKTGDKTLKINEFKIKGRREVNEAMAKAKANSRSRSRSVTAKKDKEIDREDEAGRKKSDTKKTRSRSGSS